MVNEVATTNVYVHSSYKPPIHDEMTTTDATQDADVSTNVYYTTTTKHIQHTGYIGFYIFVLILFCVMFIMIIILIVKIYILKRDLATCRVLLLTEQLIEMNVF